MKIYKAIESTQSQITGMDEGILLAYASMLSNVPCLFIGNPGTAKSHTFKSIASQTGQRDIDWFYQSITAKTSPEKVIGGVIADKMLAGIESYNLEVGAASKKGIILDEIYKSQHPAFMDMILSLLDEHPTVFTDGKNITPAYQWFYATTNFEDIDGINLRYCPKWDRFGAKYVVKGLSDEQSKATLLQQIGAKNTKNSVDAVTLTEQDIKDARDAALKIKLEDSTINKFYEIIKKTIEKYCYLSQRKIHQIFVGKDGYPSILQSLALLLKQNSITNKLLSFLPYFCWQDLSIFDSLISNVSALCISKVEIIYQQIRKDYTDFIQKIAKNSFKSYAEAQQNLDILNDAVIKQTKAINPIDKSDIDASLRKELGALKKNCQELVNKIKLAQAPDAMEEQPF
jgi:MoxR-like ATPase